MLSDVLVTFVIEKIEALKKTCFNFFLKPFFKTF